MDIWTIFRYSGLHFYLLEEVNGRIDQFQGLWFVFLPFGGDEWTYRPFSGTLVGIFELFLFRLCPISKECSISSGNPSSSG